MEHGAEGRAPSAPLGASRAGGRFGDRRPETGDRRRETGESRQQKVKNNP